MFSDEEIKDMFRDAHMRKATAQVNVGDLCWFRNEEYEEDDLSGASFPFFVGEVLSIDEENHTVDLKIATEKGECNESKYNSGPFTIK
jgi:hypothetical protein